jgi:hypothetical protein
VQNWVATAIIDIDGGMAYPILIDELRAGNDLDGMIHHHLKKLVDELLGR